MKYPKPLLRRAFALGMLSGCLASVWCGSAGLAQTPAATPNPLSYDDPGMHFQPPDGWKRIPIDAEARAQSDDKAPVAVYVKNQGRNDQAIILVAVQPFDGSLDAFEGQHESELRQGSDGVFIDKKPGALANGMPAYYLKVNAGSEAGKFTRRYEWVVVDTQRSIVVSLVSRTGDVDDKEAAAALSSLYVVVYPRHRA